VLSAGVFRQLEESRVPAALAEQVLEHSLAVGVLAGWGLVSGFDDQGVDVFQVPVGTLVGLAVLAGLLGMAAAVVPAWRASRLDVLRAIQGD